MSSFICNGDYRFKFSLGYYQPAGPLIQSHHDQYTIHKPVPYHPQPHLHQPPSRPQPPSSHRDAFSSLDPGRMNQKSSALPSQAPAVKSNSALPLHSTGGEIPHSSFKSSQERGLKPASYSTSPKPISPSTIHPPYPVQCNYRDYHKSKSVNTGGTYPKCCDPNAPPPSHSFTTGLPHTSSYQKNRHTHVETIELGSPHDNQGMGHQQLEAAQHSSSYSGSRENHKIVNDPYIKEPNWSIKINPDDSPHTPVSFLPYHIDPGKETSSVTISESSRQPERPPSVIEIVEENSRDTKTYIQLEVPKHNYREKIVVVDVENDEINKECDLPTNSNNTTYDISQEKTALKKVAEIPANDNCTKTESCNNIPDVVDVETIPEIKSLASPPPPENNSDSAKESPEIMVIEVKKKKESAVIRRARLHGKQRTFRDAYNRPLVPLSKMKKSEPAVTEEVVEKPVVSETPLPPPPLPPPKMPEKKFPHGWSWEGQTFQKQVYVSVSAFFLSLYICTCM